MIYCLANEEGKKTSFGVGYMELFSRTFYYLLTAVKNI